MLGKFFKRFFIAFRQPAFLIPLASYVFTTLVFWSLIQAAGCHGFDINCWNRWDSGLYLQIAGEGYSLVPCPETPQDWCGNAGWAPLLPLLSRWLHELSKISLEASALVVVNLFYLGSLLLAARIADFKNFGVKNWLTILLFSFFPGCVYFHALFPISLSLFAVLLVFYGMKSERWAFAGLGGVLAVLSYSSGFFIAIPIGVYWAIDFFKKKKLNLKGSLMTLLPIVVAFGGLLAYFQWKLGHWDALFLVQEKYGHGLYSPLKLLGQHLDGAASIFRTAKGTIEAQTILMVLLALYFIFDILKRLSKEFNAQFQYFLLSFVLVMWFLPFSMGPNISLYRGCILLAPLVLFQKDRPLIFNVLQLVIFVSFAVGMTFLFFIKTLI